MYVLSMYKKENLRKGMSGEMETDEVLRRRLSRRRKRNMFIHFQHTCIFPWYQKGDIRTHRQRQRQRHKKKKKIERKNAMPIRKKKKKKKSIIILLNLLSIP